MNLNEYIKTCKVFAADTASWGGLDNYQFYTTDGVGGWTETCDNAHGGLYIEWAFHCSDEEIETDAKWRYESQLRQELDDALADRDFDLEQWHFTLERYSIPAPASVDACRVLAAAEITRIDNEVIHD